MSACPVVRIKASHTSQGDFVEINESDFDPAKHERYVAPLAPLPPIAPPPVVAVAVNPLAGLRPDWRDTMETGPMRELAARVSGRSVENRDQAVAVIAEAIGAGK